MLRMMDTPSLLELYVLDEFALLDRVARSWGREHAFRPWMGGRRPRGLRPSSALRSLWFLMARDLESQLFLGDVQRYQQQVRLSVAAMMAWVVGDGSAPIRQRARQRPAR